MVLTSEVVNSRNILFDDAVLGNGTCSLRSVCKHSICCAVSLKLDVLLRWKAQYTYRCEGKHSTPTGVIYEKLFQSQVKYLSCLPLFCTIFSPQKLFFFSFVAPNKLVSLGTVSSLWHLCISRAEGKSVGREQKLR